MVDVNLLPAALRDQVLDYLQLHQPAVTTIFSSQASRKRKRRKGNDRRPAPVPVPIEPDHDLFDPDIWYGIKNPKGASSLS